MMGAWECRTGVPPLTRSLAQRERGRGFNGCGLPPLHPHSLADADTLVCQIAWAGWMGEGWGEGRVPQ